MFFWCFQKRSVIFLLRMKFAVFIKIKKHFTVCTVTKKQEHTVIGNNHNRSLLRTWCLWSAGQYLCRREFEVGHPVENQETISGGQGLATVAPTTTTPISWGKRLPDSSPYCCHYWHSRQKHWEVISIYIKKFTELKIQWTNNSLNKLL